MPLITCETITRTFLERVHKTPEQIGFRYKSGNNWQSVSFRHFYEECRNLSHGLIQLGVKTGDRIAIMARTRYEWSLTDMAILGSRAITVPVYAQYTPHDIANILYNSTPKIFFVENQTLLEKVFALLKKDQENPISLETIVLMDPFENSKQDADLPFQILTLNQLIQTGSMNVSANPALFDENLTQISPDDLMTICYTPGTTGTPKGAM